MNTKDTQAQTLADWDWTSRNRSNPSGSSMWKLGGSSSNRIYAVLSGLTDVVIVGGVEKKMTHRTTGSH
jgi:acetyl-CoA acetyltransferase